MHHLAIECPRRAEHGHASPRLHALGRHRAECVSSSGRHQADCVHGGSLLAPLGETKTTCFACEAKSSRPVEAHLRRTGGKRTAPAWIGMSEKVTVCANAGGNEKLSSLYPQKRKASFSQNLRSRVCTLEVRFCARSLRVSSCPTVPSVGGSSHMAKSSSVTFTRGNSQVTSAAGADCDDGCSANLRHLATATPRCCSRPTAEGANLKSAECWPPVVSSASGELCSRCPSSVSRGVPSSLTRGCSSIESSCTRTPPGATQRQCTSSCAPLAPRS
mmetsp:Transcript_1261/g.2910  ORF Transcript_1261/g.2910 Transcript_1261/m.2910 type:complete len:274 (+) Transcript_1261:284-1105(+)